MAFTLAPFAISSSTVLSSPSRQASLSCSSATGLLTEGAAGASARLSEEVSSAALGSGLWGEPEQEHNNTSKTNGRKWSLGLLFMVSYLKMQVNKMIRHATLVQILPPYRKRTLEKHHHENNKEHKPDHTDRHLV
jgi:hypothetical protein